MKKLFTILLTVLLTASVFAQAPEKMSYQAVIRNSSDQLVVNTKVGMKISIRKITDFGKLTIVYAETQTPTTNSNGLITIQIGAGTKFSGDFTTIKWENGEYEIHTECDPKGGTDYTITGTSQLLSVPYALHAKTAGGSHYVGESYGGGIVFWVDAAGQHGLIAATADHNSTGVQWHNGIERFTGTYGDGLYAGAMNTAMIIATQMADNFDIDFAAKVCANFSNTVGGVTYGDWYLPSKYELNLLYLQKAAVGGFASAYYWSSTEYFNDQAWGQFFDDGHQNEYSKNNNYRVRAIRDF